MKFLNFSLSLPSALAKRAAGERAVARASRASTICRSSTRGCARASVAPTASAASTAFVSATSAAFAASAACVASAASTEVCAASEGAVSSLNKGEESGDTLLLSGLPNEAPQSPSRGLVSV
eukprot:CAMPEP_0170480388 /NCGR_PEP_ID=MMETSP0208-20121228/1246_1 /TAXON_ID=197538 /ORGANISM="Strombidium inclinatum, Strain S3" /LENGTH=121 /DNA_ID=CAMNT_0010752927 /DNA_START=2299 /DNA_END=2665 /DNA_ORIENTATION=-